MFKLKKLLLLMCIFTVVSISGCNQKTETVEQSIKNAITALKSQDEKNIKKYFAVTQEDIEDNNLYNDEDKELLKKYFKKLECKVISSEISKDSVATAKVEITNFDMTDVMKEFFNIMMNNSNQELDDDEALNYLIECIDKSEKTKSFSIDLNLVKNDNIWKLSLDDSLLDALTGGVMSTVNILDEITQ